MKSCKKRLGKLFSTVGLSEADALDVYYHGSIVKNNMMVRKYNGYELGIWFFADRVTGKPIISSVWRRARR